MKFRMLVLARTDLGSFLLDMRNYFATAEQTY